MIRIHVEFDNNKVSGKFETFDEVHNWLQKVSTLKEEKEKKLCIGFMNSEKNECEEPEDEEEKEND